MRLLRARPSLVDGVLAACLGAFAQWMVWSGSVAGPRVAVAALFVLVGFPLIIRRRAPLTRVEVLIPDCKGVPDALDTIFAARPDVLNHNIETVPRLQRLVRPSASYGRSLAVLARAKEAGLVTKSGLILGLGEDEEEVMAALADLRAVGTDIVTVGQYLRPTAQHLPVARWWSPEEFDRIRARGEALGIGHVESSPLTRSSYHAGQAAEVAIRSDPPTRSAGEPRYVAN